MATRSQVLSDIALLRQSLRRAGNLHLPLLKLQPWRPVTDFMLDLTLIGAALVLMLKVPWAAPVSLLLLGNRQRALGNILHDAAHRNLTRHRLLNDLMTQAFVAPLLFLSLSRYRALHFRHHLELGARGADPDLIPIPPLKAPHWLAALAVNALSLRAVASATLGHLVDRGVSLCGRLYILGWWAALVTGLGVAWGVAQAAAMLGLWLFARATVFHLITTFREMCDHHGLYPGGVFSFTRDIPVSGLWALLIHPRHNAYHLTHHLLPAVPYYRLPEAQRVFAMLPEYRLRAVVCRSYFAGPTAVVTAWQREAAR